MAGKARTRRRTLAAPASARRVVVDTRARAPTDNKEVTMKVELLSFLEWALELSILLNIFMAGLCGVLIYQDRKTAVPASNRTRSRMMR